MKRGCTQGSSFGPTLWNLYQNDLSYHINEIANLSMYADDHQMYKVGGDSSHSETYMNLLDGAKLPSLLNRRLQDIVILMYKVKYRLVPGAHQMELPSQLIS